MLANSLPRLRSPISRTTLSSLSVSAQPAFPDSVLSAMARWKGVTMDAYAMADLAYQVEREDATNVFDAPLAAVITPVALDHTAWLGRTIEEILAESTKGKTSLEAMHEACSRDHFLTSEEALEMGLIDEILGQNPKI